MLRGFRRTAIFTRRYRVDATILLCGVPMLSRRGVGGGYAVVEVGTAGQAIAVALQFVGGSWPEHAGGLNRFGVLREVVVSRDRGSTDFAFSGLVTSSKEEDLSDARKALRSAVPAVQVTVARGFTSNGRFRTWSQLADIPHEQTWIEAAKLLNALAVDEAVSAPREIGASGALTFLAAMRSAAFGSQPVFRIAFVHGGEQFVLEAQRRTNTPSVLTCLIRDTLGRKTADFRVIYDADDDSGIPTRIEYRAKSFLRLAFEAEPESVPSTIESLFQEEST